MLQEEGIAIVVNGLVFLLAAWLVGYLFRLTLTPPQPGDMRGDVDFEEFYLDLCASSLTVDFTREEAEGLYRTSQRQEKATR